MSICYLNLMVPTGCTLFFSSSSICTSILRCLHKCPWLWIPTYLYHFENHKSFDWISLIHILSEKGLWTMFYMSYPTPTMRWCRTKEMSFGPESDSVLSNWNGDKSWRVLCFLMSWPCLIVFLFAFVCVFLAVQDSTITDIVCLSVPWSVCRSQLTIRA